MTEYFFWLKFKNEDQLENRSYLRSPAVGGRHHPLWVDEGASTEVVAHKKKRGLVLDGVRLHLYSPDDSLPKHSWERMREFINNYMPYSNILHKQDDSCSPVRFIKTRKTSKGW